MANSLRGGLSFSGIASHSLQMSFSSSVQVVGCDAAERTLYRWAAPLMAFLLISENSGSFFTAVHPPLLYSAQKRSIFSGFQFLSLRQSYLRLAELILLMVRSGKNLLRISSDVRSAFALRMEISSSVQVCMLRFVIPRLCFLPVMPAFVRSGNILRSPER